MLHCASSQTQTLGMAVTKMATLDRFAFSHDNKYLATCGIDGKLKIWETATNRLKQEYVPNLHLTTPCGVLTWIAVSRQSTSNSASPWKKRRRKSVNEDGDESEMVAMGSVHGTVVIYDVACASIVRQLDNGHAGEVGAICWSEASGLFTAGDDRMIVEWSIKDNVSKLKWKSGKEKITAIVLSPDEKSLIAAGKSIRWWNLLDKSLIATFTGHASAVTSLNAMTVNGDNSYVISAASADRNLNVWSLNKENFNKNAAAIFSMQDDAISVSARITDDAKIDVLAVTRSGMAHLFKHQPNGRMNKPTKPLLNLMITSNRASKESIQQIPILTAKLTDDARLLIAYGSCIHPTFERIVPDFSEKLQCLIRSENKKSTDRNELAITKLKSTEDKDAEYVGAGAPTPMTKRNKSGASSQLPMEIRLENLSLKAANTFGEAPTKAANMAHLLMQGLHSKDKNILRDVLLNKDETLIRSTIVRLPVETIAPLLKELTTLLQGKPYAARIAIIWTKILLQTFAGHLMSYPDIGDLVAPILGTVDAKLNLLPQLCRLRGRVSLVTGQISQASEKQDKLNGESLLIYQEPDSTDEDSDMEELASGSESDEIWEEASDQDISPEVENTNDRQLDDNDDDNVSMSS